jgi:hypothetical protein
VFIGHYAVGFASKRFAPRTSLGLLIGAPLLLDLLWPVFLLAGIEHARIDPGNTAFTPVDLYDYPWSHSLAMTVLWSGLAAGLYWIATRYVRGAVAIGGGVLSHWLLDFVTHRADMPLYPGGLKVGLGLWNSVAGTLAVEVTMFVASIWIYVRATEARDRAGSLGFWSFVGLLVLIYTAAVVGPPPPSMTSLAWLGLSTWALLLWPHWFDLHRIERR